MKNIHSIFFSKKIYVTVVEIEWPTSNHVLYIFTRIDLAITIAYKEKNIVRKTKLKQF